MAKLGADVIVIGGGSSGAVVAARLAAAGIDVILVEAGPDYGPLAGRALAVGDPRRRRARHHTRLGLPPRGERDGRPRWTFERARILGGCSAHNGAIAAVGHHTDYDAWGLPGWSTDELRPLFAIALAAMRVRAYTDDEAGPFHAAVSARPHATAGWHIASDLCDLDANTSFGLETVNVVDGVRWNTAFAYLDGVRSLGHLEIVDRTIVDRIELTHGSATVHVVRDGRRARSTATPWSSPAACTAPRRSFNGRASAIPITSARSASRPSSVHRWSAPTCTIIRWSTPGGR